MTESSWTKLEPEPGDFDRELTTIDPRYIEPHPGDPNAKVRIFLTVDGDDAIRLQRIAAARGQRPNDVVADLLRDADGSGA